jgi:hypothetical protein
MPDVTASLSGPDKNAYVAIQQMLAQFGLDSLAPHILDYIKNGYDATTIQYELQQTPEWKKRFAANETRAKNGLPVLSPQEYIATERAYRQIMTDAGLPKGFYDSSSDFTQWIAADVSPTEIQSRVKAASDLVQNADKGTLDYFKQFYSTGDIIAYALDQKRAAPLVGKQFEAAKIGGAAADQGLALGQQTAEALASAGLSGDQAKQGFSQVAQEKAASDNLASIYGQQHLTTDQLATDMFIGDAQVAAQRQKLASQERGSFSGASGIGQGSLSRNTGGNL